jgi:hypothetical protein
MAAGQQDSPPGAPVYADYIAEQVVREDARKESVERRGLAVVTTSGALATLLFALAALSTKANDFHLSGWSEFFLALAVVAFVVAAGFAIATNLPLNYEEVEPDELLDAVREKWGDSKIQAERMSSFTRLKVLKKAREQNGRKANWLFDAIVAEGFGVLFVAIAVLVILI